MLARARRKLGLSPGMSSSAGKLSEREMTSTAPLEVNVECETFHRLETFVNSERFLEKLEEQRQQLAGPQPTQQRHEGPSSIPELMRDGMNSSITRQASSQSVPCASFDVVSTSSGSSTETAFAPVAAPAEASFSEDPDYVLIDKQSAVEAMAFYIAETLMKCPQAFTMSPTKLQEAIVLSIRGMKQSRFKQLCKAGHHAYRWGALGYSAFQMYSNPWICQAILQAIWAFSRMTMRSWI